MRECGVYHLVYSLAIDDKNIGEEIKLSAAKINQLGYLLREKQIISNFSLYAFEKMVSVNPKIIRIQDSEHIFIRKIDNPYFKQSSFYQSQRDIFEIINAVWNVMEPKEY